MAQAQVGLIINGDHNINNVAVSGQQLQQAIQDANNNPSQSSCDRVKKLLRRYVLCSCGTWAASAFLTTSAAGLIFQFSPSLPSVTIHWHAFTSSVVNFFGLPATQFLLAAAGSIVFVIKGLIETIGAIWKRQNRGYSKRKDINIKLFWDDIRRIWISNLAAGAVAFTFTIALSALCALVGIGIPFIIAGVAGSFVGFLTYTGISNKLKYGKWRSPKLYNKLEFNKNVVLQLPDDSTDGAGPEHETQNRRECAESIDFVLDRLWVAAADFKLQYAIIGQNGSQMIHLTEQLIKRRATLQREVIETSEQQKYWEDRKAEIALHEMILLSYLENIHHTGRFDDAKREVVEFFKHKTESKCVIL